jgi:hypothetical protein
VNQQGTSGNDDDLVGSAWTLHWFAKVDFPQPGKPHIERMNAFLRLMAEAPANATATKIAAISGSILGGNKYARESFLETLGVAGVLSVPRLPGLLQTWTPWQNRPQSGEMIAPAALWRRSAGVNAAVFAELFPRCKIPKGLAAARV